MTLTPKKKIVIKKPIELTIVGIAPSGLEDSPGRLIDGNHDGQPGGHGVAILTKKGKSVSANPQVATDFAIDYIVEGGHHKAPAIKK